MNTVKGAKVDAIIFDLDGTLLYTLPDIARAINGVLRAHGYPEHAEEEYKTLVGHGLRESVKHALPEGVDEEGLVDRLAEELTAEYRREPAAATVPYKGIPELLDYLSAAGIPTAVLTNKRQDVAREVVRRVLPQWRFTAVLGDGGDFPRKPETASSVYLARHLETEPEQVLFLGDSGVDMETAAGAGMIPGGVLWGYRSREELLQSGAWYLFASPQEVIDLLS